MACFMTQRPQSVGKYSRGLLGSVHDQRILIDDPQTLIRTLIPALIKEGRLRMAKMAWCREGGNTGRTGSMISKIPTL